MAQIPTALDVPQVGGGALRAPAPRVSPQAFGGGASIAEGIGEAVDKVIVSENARLTREDAVDRARKVREFNTFAHEEFRRIQTEEDLSDPEVAKTYAESLRSKRDEFISQHTGNEVSASALMDRLEAVRVTLTDTAGEASTTAQRALVNDSLRQDIEGAALTAGAAPESVFDTLKSIDAFVDDMAPALTADEERDQRAAGKSLAVSAAMETMLTQGNIEGAKDLLAAPGVKEFLGSQAILKVETRIAKREQDARKGEIEGKQAIAKAQAILGPDVEITEEMKLSIAGLSDDRVTPTQKITEINAALVASGQPEMTPAQTEEALGIAVGDTARTFGKGLQGQALQAVTDLSPAFADGLLSADDERQFLASVNALQQPITFTNPDTGILETRVPTLPAFVTDALRRRGIEQAPQAEAPTGVMIEPEVVEVEPEIALEDDPLQGLPSIFDTAAQATGIGPKTAEFIGGLPVVGGLADADIETQISRRLDLATNNLINVLRRNPKFVEGERTSLKEEFSVSGKFFDNPRAFQNRIKGIDDGLKIRLKEAQTILDAPTTTKAERTVAIRERNAIENFRAQLGAPPTVKTAEEAAAFPPGTQFFDPAGTLRMVPETE